MTIFGFLLGIFRRILTPIFAFQWFHPGVFFEVLKVPLWLFGYDNFNWNQFKDVPEEVGVPSGGIAVIVLLAMGIASMILFAVVVEKAWNWSKLPEEGENEEAS
jgi:hypothetical protein